MGPNLVLLKKNSLKPGKLPNWSRLSPLGFWSPSKGPLLTLSSKPHILLYYLNMEILTWECHGFFTVVIKEHFCASWVGHRGTIKLYDPLFYSHFCSSYFSWYLIVERELLFSWKLGQQSLLWPSSLPLWASPLLSHIVIAVITTEIFCRTEWVVVEVLWLHRTSSSNVPYKPKSNGVVFARHRQLLSIPFLPWDNESQYPSGHDLYYRLVAQHRLCLPRLSKPQWQTGLRLGKMVAVSCGLELALWEGSS